MFAALDRFKHMRTHPQSRVGIVTLLWLLASAAPLLAHPMGNFSVNHYSRIGISQTGIEIRYLIDMAEIPTYQELQEKGIRANEQDPALTAYVARKCQEFRQGLSVALDGKVLELSCAGREVIFPAGAGGLPTMKFGFFYQVMLPKAWAGASHRLLYRDDNFPARTGWKEVIVASTGNLKLTGNVPSVDRSAQLSDYPTDLLNSPPQDLEAIVDFTVPADSIRHTSLAAASLASSGKARSPQHPNRSAKEVEALNSEAILPNAKKSSVNAPRPLNITSNRQATPRSAFTELISKQELSLWFLITAALIAMGLGALHALEPGHGKTLVAAYLVGSRGTPRHAVILGLIVTLAHTAGVYALGGITLYASRYVLPEKIFPWLSLVSGLTIAGFGIYLLLQRWTAEQSADLSEDHRHWYEVLGSRKTGQAATVESSASSALAPATPPASLRQLLLLGITGGMVPCPAALVVLLSAVALHRLQFGLFLIVCFSVGLATVLIGIGLLMVRAGRLVTRFNSNGIWLRRRLPLLSAACIAILGIGLSIQALTASGLLRGITYNASPRWLLVAGLGLLLGMRHSTDSDHVIAVTTIVTRLGSLRHASLVGMLWGVGHTLTIFIVGSAIILFGIVIPPRLGLSMEFAVAVMLILLGILNLTGVLNWGSTKYRGATSIDSISDSASASLLPTEKSLESAFSRMGTYQVLRPFVIGIVHGLAGSAAVALLVLATIRNPVWAIGYLLLFGLGTVLGMMLMTAAIALPVVWSGKNFMRLNRYMYATSGVVSLAFGLFLVYQIGFVSGLFTSFPKWTPQ